MIIIIDNKLTLWLYLGIYETQVLSAEFSVNTCNYRVLLYRYKYAVSWLTRHSRFSNYNKMKSLFIVLEAVSLVLVVYGIDTTRE